MLRFANPAPRRRPNLTPMIDVVFLLLVFFMLAARFGQPGAVPVNQSGASGDADVPRLITIAPSSLTLNGVATNQSDLLLELDRLTNSKGDVVILRPDPKTDLQRVVDVIQDLEDAGFTSIAVVE